MSAWRTLGRWLPLAAFGMLSTLAAAETSSLQAVGTYAVEETDVTYAQADGLQLRARIYRPKTQGPLPAIVDVHGGAWSSGDRNAGRVYDHALASAGLFVFAIDFRQAPAFQHPAANRDIAKAVRYLRSHAEDLQIEADTIGLVGSSSGGHLAMLAALLPNSDAFRDGDADNGGDAAVRYVIALWPVSNPAYRYDYAQRVGRAELVRAHDAYFGTRERMEEASVPRILRAKQATHQPPLLVVQPGNDGNIPLEMTFDLMQAYQEAGGRVDYLFYPGQPHAFGHRPSAATTDLIVAMRDFIARALAQ